MYDYYHILSFYKFAHRIKKNTLSSVLSNQGSVCSFISKDENFALNAWMPLKKKIYIKIYTALCFPIWINCFILQVIQLLNS